MDALDSLAVDYPQPADISPWSAHEAEIALADRVKSYATAANEHAAVLIRADAARDKAITTATTEAASAVANSVASFARDAALAAGELAWATATSIAENALAALGLQSPELPSAPSMTDLSARPHLLPQAVDHYFSANDNTREPYAALVLGMYDYAHSSPGLQLILDGQYPKQLTTDQLLESVIHTGDPMQDDAAARMLINREHGIRASNAGEVMSDVGVYSTTHDPDSGEFTIEVAPRVAGPLRNQVLLTTQPDLFNVPLYGAISGAAPRKELVNQWFIS